MEENQQNAKGTDIAHGENEQIEELSFQLSAIGEFFANNVTRHIPAHKEARQESADGKHDLSGDEVE